MNPGVARKFSVQHNYDHIPPLSYKEQLELPPLNNNFGGITKIQKFDDGTEVKTWQQKFREHIFQFSNIFL